MAEMPAYHWRTHLPGGSDEIPFPTSSISWAKAWMSLKSISNSSSYFRAKWEFLATNDPDLFELVDVTGGLASWVQINDAGYYEMKGGIVTSAGWGANYTNLEFIYAESGSADFQVSSAVDAFTDFTESDYAMGSEQDSDEFHTSPNTHRGLWKPYTFRYDPSSPGASDLSDENPLKLSIRTTSDAAGPISMTAGLWIARIASDATYTLQDVT